MTQHSSLDLIQIASPCHAAWDDMTGDERRRFCKQCNLHVYNLSDMPRDDAEAFVSRAEGRTCIRLHRRADGTVLTRDCPVGLRALRQRLVRSVAALAGMTIALLTGSVFGGRLKIAGLDDLKKPSRAFAEWIEPGSTTVIMGAFCLPPPPIVVVPVNGAAGVADEIDPLLEAPESPLPEPTPEQLEEIAERLR